MEYDTATEDSTARFWFKSKYKLPAGHSVCQSANLIICLFLKKIDCPASPHHETTPVRNRKQEELKPETEP